ncbi:MAG: hypothetical protein ABIR26_15245 [Ramlibacter sp.]
MLKVSRRALSGLFLLIAASGAAAQSSCSSDGRPRPVALVERFISADCEACWREGGAAKPARGQLVLDWIVPGSRGDDAPLSAAATRDAVARLEALHLREPVQSEVSRRKVTSSVHRVRVAHGLPFQGYLGTSIELKPGRGGPWTAWLLLVETIPAGTDGTPVARNLVRNVVQPAWGGDRELSKAEQRRLFESRPMSIPEGAKPERLRVVGLVEDARGRVVAVSASGCGGR